MKSSEIGSETISTLLVEKREKNVESRTFNANEFFGGLKRKEMKKMFGASLQEDSERPNRVKYRNTEYRSLGILTVPNRIIPNRIS